MEPNLIYYLIIGVLIALIVVLNLNSKKRIKDIKTRLSQYKEMLTLMKVGTWEGTLKSSINEWSDELYELYGLSPHKHTPFRENFYELVHPDEREEYRKELYKAIESGSDFHLTYRAMHSDGEYRWFETHGKVIWEEGKSIGFHGTVQDITRFKKDQSSDE